jgi:hypothetical protein
MHPIVTAYLQWRRLFVWNVFGGRTDLKDARKDAWQFYKDLCGSTFHG